MIMEKQSDANPSMESSEYGREWEHVDARVLGQLLAAQNLLFVLPDDARIEEFLTQALSELPGIESCFVCLGEPPLRSRSELCHECIAGQKKESAGLPRSLDFSCPLSVREDVRTIPVRSRKNTFGFFIFRIGSGDALDPYLPFLSNLANFVALSLENRIQRFLLEKSRDELEERVRQRTEELSIANERFALAASAAGLGVWDWDIQNDKLVWDDRMYALYGIEKGNFTEVYEAWVKGLHPEDRIRSEEVSKLALQGKCEYDTEFRVIWSDGSIHYIKAIGQIIRDSRGKPLRMTGLNYDITDRKRAETALKESEQSHRELLANLPVAIVLHNPDGSVRYRNSAAQELLGLQGIEDVERYLHNPQWHFVNDAGAAIVEGEEPANIVINEKRNLRDYVIGIVRSGVPAPLWVYVNAFPELDSQGKLQQVVVTFVEFTERKRLEEDLQKLNETLEMRVIEELKRNREKDHLLIQQSRLAAMGEMVHNIAHQWRQPLNAVSLILSNIQDDYEYEELTRDTLATSVSQAQGILKQMSRTIDDFRNFFRPDRVPEEFDMQKSVSDALSIIDASFKNSQIEIALSLESGLKVFGFSSQFAQAILNILTNAQEALKNRKTSGGKISLLLKRVGDLGALIVKDNGGGIPEDILPRIFDPYFTTKQRGSGIGLYMSRMIIEHNLKGTILAKNDDAGAVITISLPLVAENRGNH